MIARAAALDALRRHRFDVIVIGGGITGAGVALDAASRGLSVALVEKHDFSSGTSSRSSKVIHGGVRYLARMQFGMTMESVRERERLLRMAPHLVKRLPILLPYRRAAPYKIALSLYDAMAPTTRHHEAVRDIRRFAPMLRRDGVRGAFHYFDATVDDCRLVMHVIRKAAELGAVAANYVEATAVSDGGIEARDVIGGHSLVVRGATIVNATGVWSDEMRHRLDPAATPLLTRSKGIHLVLERERLRLEGGVVIPKTSRGHYLFITPWQGQIVVGTTDTIYDGDSDRPLALREDVAVLLDALAEWFPAAGVSGRDIIAVYAGLRALHGRIASTAAASREDFVERRGNFITVSGGKLTTFRRMAERVVDMITSARCVTDTLSLFASAAPPGRLPQPLAMHLHESFGSDAHVIAKMDGADARLSETHPQTIAEIDFVIREEMAMTIGDVLARRTRLALLTRDRAMSHAPLVADRLAEYHGWTGSQRNAAIDVYRAEVSQYAISDR